MKFNLVSKYRPTGDQPLAIEKLETSLRARNEYQTLLGVTGSGKTFTVANLIQRLNVPTLVISHNKTLAAQLYQEFRDFFPDNAVSYFVSYYDYYQPESYLPATDTYIEKETDINDEIDKLRLSTTTNLLSRPDTIVVASVSCIYNLGSPLEYAKNYLTLIPGQVIDRKSVMARLIDMQYQRSDFELKRGSFRLRGDTLTVWPANLDQPLALNFLESTLQSIVKLEAASGENLGAYLPHETLSIYPAKHYQAVSGDLEASFKEIKRDLAIRLKELKSQGKIVEAYRLAQKVKYDLEMIQELGYVNGIENYSRYFDGRKPGDPPYTLLDYFDYNAKNIAKKPFLTVIDESHITVPQLKGMYAGDRSRKQTLIEYGFRLPSALDNRPLRFEETLTRLDQVLFVSATPEEWEIEQSQPHVAEQLIRPTGLVDPDIEVRKTEGQIADLVEEIIARKKKGQRVLVTTLTKKTAEVLTEFLNEPEKVKKLAKKRGIELAEADLPKVQYLHADVQTLDRTDILDQLRLGEFDVVVGINLLREGLDLPEVSLVAILDADKQGFLRSRTSLIQTMGRAARHEEGHVILYADRISQAMAAAMEEVRRRREIQIQYNLEHGIRPTSISKPIREKLLERDLESKEMMKGAGKALKDFGWEDLGDINPDALTPKDKAKLTRKLTRLMNAAAKEWDFEKAANYRDAIQQLKS